MNQFRSDVTLSSIAVRPPYAAHVARALVPAFADYCLVYLLDQQQLRCVGLAHASKAGERLLRSLIRIYRLTLTDADSTVAHVVRSGRVALRSDIRRERTWSSTASARVLALHRELGARSALVVPIGGRDRLVGALALGYSHSGRRYVARDVELATRVADHIRLAIDNATLSWAARHQRSIARQARPALTRLRRAVGQLQVGATYQEQELLLNVVAQQEQTLSRMLDRYMASCQNAPRRALRARS